MKRTILALVLALGMSAPGAAAADAPRAIAPMVTANCVGGQFYTWPVGYSVRCYPGRYHQFRVTGACSVGPVWPSAWTASGSRAEMTCPLQPTGRPTVRIETR